MRNENITIHVYIFMLVVEFGKTLMIKLFGLNVKIVIGDNDFQLILETEIIAVVFAFLITINFCFLLCMKYFRIRFHRCLYYLTTFFYVMINITLLIFDEYIFKITKNLTNNNQIEGEIIFYTQTFTFFAWSILSTYVYLIINGKFDTILQTYGGAVFVFIRLLFVVFILLFFTDLCYGLFYHTNFWVINLSVCIVQLFYIIMQMSNLLIAIRFNQRQNLLLKYFIFAYFVTLIFLQLLNYITELDYNQLLIFTIFLWSHQIQVRSIQQAEEEFHYQIYEFCQICGDYITKDDQIVYYNDNLALFHQQCHLRYYDYDMTYKNFYIIKLQDSNYIESQSQKIFTLISMLLINILFYRNFYINYIDLQNDKPFNIQNIFQIITIALILFLQFINYIKNNLCTSRIQFYLFLVSYLSYYYNYWIVYQIYKQQDNAFCIENRFIKESNSYDEFFIGCTKEQYLQVVIMILYYFKLLLLQGYLFKQIILTPCLNKKYDIILIHLFVVMNITSIMFQLHLFSYQLVIQVYLVFQNILNFILLCYCLINKFNTQLNSIKIKKAEELYQVLDVYFVYVIMILIVLIIISSSTYDKYFYDDERWINAQYDFYGLNSYFAERKWLFYRLMFIQLLMCLIQIFYIRLFCVQTVGDLKQKKQLISNQDLFQRPNIAYLNQLSCQYCKKQFKMGNIIIYRSICQHLVHKSCIKKWLNYPWCCKIQNNYDIQIMLQ